MNDEIKEEDILKSAKKSLKVNIKFLETLIKHLNGTNKSHKTGAVLTAWCLNEYIKKTLAVDIEKVMKEQEHENVE